MFQLQFNRRSFTSSAPDWQPMPEGAGTVQLTRPACERLKAGYLRTYKRVFGEPSPLQLRIVALPVPRR